MSCQKGSSSRNRAQKYQNRTAFKNNLHDTSKTTKVINTLAVEGCCTRCKEIIEWKIKYKKYKPLTIPKKCIKCGQKTVKRAYYIVCQPCGESQDICTKCGQKSEDIRPQSLTEEERARQESQLAAELKLLPERKRRTFLRQQESGQLTDSSDTAAAATCGPTGDADDSDICGTDSESDCVGSDDGIESSEGEICADKNHKKVTFTGPSVKTSAEKKLNENDKDADLELSRSDGILTDQVKKIDLLDDTQFPVKDT